MKTRTALTLAALAAVLAPIGARAHHCSSKLVMYTYARDFVPTTVGPFACQVDDGHTAPVDSRLISPGTDTVQLVYLADIAADKPTTTGLLNGLGFANKVLHYTRTVDTSTGLAVVWYSSESIALPTVVSGCLTGDILLDVDDSDVETRDYTSYHTADASCPDYP